MTKLPLIIIFDLDKTLIGNSNSFTYKQSLFSAIDVSNKASKLSKKYKFKALSYKQVLGNKLEILRPFVIDFFKEIEERYKDVEFFVYSAGTKQYVEGIIEWIEEKLSSSHVAIKFNRPIYSRESTVSVDRSYNKSIKLYFHEDIVPCLNKKYPDLNDSKTTDFVLKNRVLFIDDRDDVLWDKDINFIQCPEYNFSDFEDITFGIDKEILQEKVITTFLDRNNYPYFKEPSDVIEYERNMQYHIWMAENYQKYVATNKIAINDDFFKKFMEWFKTVYKLKKPFTSKTVEKLAKRLV